MICILTVFFIDALTSPCPVGLCSGKSWIGRECMLLTATLTLVMNVANCCIRRPSVIPYDLRLYPFELRFSREFIFSQLDRSLWSQTDQRTLTCPMQATTPLIAYFPLRSTVAEFGRVLTDAVELVGFCNCMLDENFDPACSIAGLRSLNAAGKMLPCNLLMHSILDARWALRFFATWGSPI